MFLSEMHHSVTVMKWGWTLQMFLHFIISGTRSLVTVHQPPLLAAALGHDVIMPCHLNLSPDEKLMIPPVLYLVHLIQDNTSNPTQWTPSEKYGSHFYLLNHNVNTSDKSVLLKNVQWADSGKYLCKLSITTQRDKSFRRKGNGTLLKVYDTMNFNLSGHNDSLLQCDVKVTQDLRFVLSIFHNGYKLQPVDSASGDADAALPYVTLSETISLWSEGEYECQLHLNGDLITKSIFHYPPPVTEDGGYAEKNASLTRPTTVSGMVVNPEPWLLYMGFLLVHIIILLSLVTAMLMYRCEVCQHLERKA